jgi:hypothetical protein
MRAPKTNSISVQYMLYLYLNLFTAYPLSEKARHDTTHGQFKKVVEFIFSSLLLPLPDIVM